MTRMMSLTAAAGSAFLLLSATAGHAANGHYIATPVAQPAKTSVITKNTVWRWSDGAYAAPKAGSRPEIMCALVAQRVGELSAFTAGGEAFDADRLGRCNERAK